MKKFVGKLYRRYSDEANISVSAQRAATEQEG